MCGDSRFWDEPLIKKEVLSCEENLLRRLTSGVLALTVMAALPTIHAEAVSIWLDLTPGTESVETFQYKDYADRYSDAYELYGYDAEALFNHYETVGKAEEPGRTLQEDGGRR